MWYKSAFSKNYWTNDVRYGWFTIGISWDTPKAVDNFNESEEIKDMVEENCFLASSRIEKIGFPKQHSYVVFEDDLAESELDVGLALSHMIKLPIKLMYRENWDDLLVHEWAHRYYSNLSKDTKQYFSGEYDRIVSGAIENEGETFDELVDKVVPESIKERFPDNQDIWRVYVEKTLKKPEMQEVRDLLKNEKHVPTSYAATNADELWAESVVNYDGLKLEMKKIISSVIERG